MCVLPFCVCCEWVVELKELCKAMLDALETGRSEGVEELDIALVAAGCLIMEGRFAVSSPSLFTFHTLSVSPTGYGLGALFLLKVWDV